MDINKMMGEIMGGGSYFLIFKCGECSGYHCHQKVITRGVSVFRCTTKTGKESGTSGGAAMNRDIFNLYFMVTKNDHFTPEELADIVQSQSQADNTIEALAWFTAKHGVPEAQKVFRDGDMEEFKESFTLLERRIIRACEPRIRAMIELKDLTSNKAEDES
jgi:hypothetical protein